MQMATKGDQERREGPALELPHQFPVMDSENDAL